MSSPLYFCRPHPSKDPAIATRQAGRAVYVTAVVDRSLAELKTQPHQGYITDYNSEEQKRGRRRQTQTKKRGEAKSRSNTTMSYRRTTDFEEAEYISQPPRSRAGDSGSNHVRVMERDRDVYIDERRDRTPAFLRDGGRRQEPGPMVLRRREVESFDRHRSRSPTPPPPTRIIEERIVRRVRSESPAPREHSRTRIVETERTVSPRRRRSPSPVVRFVEHHHHARERSRSPSIVDHEHIRIIERERGRSPERSPTPSPSPSPPPAVVRGPTIEREVITHYTDIDHGTYDAWAGE